VDLLRIPWLRLPARLNTGYFGAPILRFDLEVIERFLRSWSGRTPAWVEQTCWAATAGVVGTKLFDARQFQIYRPDRAVPPDCVALHFVSSVRSHLRRFLAPAMGCKRMDVVLTQLSDAKGLTSARLFSRELLRGARRLVAGGASSA
jgi:hypothetical protein